MFVSWFSKAKYMVNVCLSATQFQLGFPDISTLSALALGLSWLHSPLQSSYLFWNWWSISCKISCWKGAPYFFPSFSLVISHPYSLGTHQCNFLDFFSYFLSCNIVISHWYADVSNRAYKNATKVCWLFYLIYIIALYTYHSYSMGI